MAIALAARRELPGLLRGVLLAVRCAGLQLAVIVQSRGWLFTLPLVVVVAIVLVPDRLRVAAAAVLPVAGTLVPVHRLLQRFTRRRRRAALEPRRRPAGHSALLVCAGWSCRWHADRLGGVAGSRAALPTRGRAASIGALAVLAVVGGDRRRARATHGHPFRFVTRQWHGFSHPSRRRDSGSHFADRRQRPLRLLAGVARCVRWRIRSAAWARTTSPTTTCRAAAPTRSRRGRTASRCGCSRTPASSDSLLFAAFLVAAIAGGSASPAPAGRARRAAVVGAALLPFVVWLIHGSVDWFWEMPALSGPALGFLGMAGWHSGTSHARARRR